LIEPNRLSTFEIRLNKMCVGQTDPLLSGGREDGTSSSSGSDSGSGPSESKDKLRGGGLVGLAVQETVQQFPYLPESRNVFTVALTSTGATDAAKCRTISARRLTTQGPCRRGLRFTGVVE